MRGAVLCRITSSSALPAFEKASVIRVSAIITSLSPHHTAVALSSTISRLGRQHQTLLPCQREQGYSTCSVNQSIEQQVAHADNNSCSTPNDTQSILSSTTKPSSTPTLSTRSTDSTPTPSSEPCNVNKKKIYNKWDEQLDTIILSLFKDHNLDWRSIGTLIGRSHTTCYTRYIRTLEPALSKGWVPPTIKDQVQLNKMVDQARSMKEARALEGARERAEAREKVEAAKAATSEVVKRATWDEASDNTIIDMLKMGKLWPEIGCALGRPYSSCYTRYYTALDPALKEPWSYEIVDQLNEKVAQGVPWKQIAKDLNMRPVTLRAKWIALNRSNATVTSGELNNREATSTIKSKSGVKWISFSKEESTQIMDLVEKHGQENWDRIHHDFQEHFLQDEPVSSSLSSSSSNSVSLKRACQRIRNITPDNLRYQYSRISRNLRSWTFDQETVLIQQVIKFGTEGHWDEVARLSGFHTPAECRSHWKQLDMPVNNLNSMAWRLTEQTTFWDLWKTVGSDFERISKLSGGSRSPEECQRYFESTTRDFPDLETNRTEFERQVEQLRETLPASRQRYIFTKQRSLRLQRIMKYYGRHGNKWAMRGTWDLVAQRFQRGLPATTCIEHWLYLNKNMDLIHGPLEQGKSTIKPEISSSWSHEELKLLDQGIRELGSSWSDIQQNYLPWRTTRSIRQRWMLMSDKSTKVTEEEYYTIVAAGTVSSEIDYRSLAKKMPGWKLSPCKRVFETSYKHILSNTVWLPEEDQLLIEKTLEIKGHDWNAIAKHFDGVETARSPLYDSAVSALGYRDKMPMRTRKSGWQCRLRWCQLVEPLMPNERIWPVSGRSLTLKLSKQLLGKIQTTT